MGDARVDDVSPYNTNVGRFADIPTSWAIITGIIRLGCTAFMISPRNSPAAVADLLRQSECNVLLVSSEPSILELSKLSLEQLPSGETPRIVMDAPSYEDLYKAAGETFESLPPYVDAGMDSTALMLHSSGLGLLS